MSAALAGQRAVITGGSRGLGRALCVAFAQAGADVAFTYNSDAESAAETLQQARCSGTRIRSIQASVLDSAATATLFAELERDWGAVDILVNNAGVVQMLPLPLIDEEDWDHVMAVNVKGAFLTAKVALKGMIRRKAGVILNIGSIAGLRILESPVHYCASKAALKGLTEALAKEVGRYGIRVNCFAPGLLESGIGVNIPQSRLKNYLQHCALGRLATLEEAARFAVFLVSQRSGYTSGATIAMDGGL